MASIIKIKRSGSTNSPSQLASGELAYSWGNEYLYLGTGAETVPGIADQIDIIGGAYYTDMLDHTHGTLTANSAIILDANSKIDILNVDNITIDGNSITSTDTNGDINITPNGSGKTVISNVYIDDVNTTLIEYIQDVTGGVSVAGEGIDITYDDTANTLTISAEDATSANKGIASFNSDFTVTAGDVVLSVTGVTAGSYGSASEIPTFTVDNKGRLTAAGTVSVATNLSMSGDTGTDTVSLLTDTLSIVGGEGIDTAITDNTITITGEDASSSNKGIASFNLTNFTVINGDVNSNNITLGGTSLTLGGSTTEILNLTALSAGNIKLSSTNIEYDGVATNGDINLIPKGSGVVSVNGAVITSVGTPVLPEDAANKGYVDSVVSGLDPKASVKAATTEEIAGLTGQQIVDGILVDAGDRVLVKNQTSDASQNGIYIVDASTWIRAEDFVTGTATAGAYVFVEEGTINADSGWVLATDGAITVGSTAVNFVQFSGAGQVVAGEGLTKTGNQLDVQVAANGGIEIVADALQLKAGVAGAGLTYNSGVVSIVGTTDRIVINPDSIDIDSNYAGQTSINTVGTLTTGTWNATTISVGYGGTGATTLASRGVLFGNGIGAVGTVTPSDTDGSLLLQDATGNAYWTNVLDGGTY